MIRGDRTYRVTGTRGTTAYLGFQVLAGTGLTPRRMAGYVSDTDLTLDGGEFALVFSATNRRPAWLDGAQWVQIPQDASSIVVREYIGDADAEQPATLRIDAVDADAAAADSPTTKRPNSSPRWRGRIDEAGHAAPHHQARTADPAQRAGHRRGRRTRRRRHHTRQPVHDRHLPARAADESLVLEFNPPDTRYWNVTLENIWHECLEPRRRHSSRHQQGRCAPDADGMVRIAIGANDFGHGHWLDTGGRHRGFVVLRWLDNPDPPDVTATVVAAEAHR